MSRIPRAKRWPQLSPQTARHVEKQLQTIDWQEITRAARAACEGCPSKDKGQDCANCPIYGTVQQCLYMAALSRAARHTDEYLQSLPIDNNGE